MIRPTRMDVPLKRERTLARTGQDMSIGLRRKTVVEPQCPCEAYPAAIIGYIRKTGFTKESVKMIYGPVRQPGTQGFELLVENPILPVVIVFKEIKVRFPGE